MWSPNNFQSFSSVVRRRVCEDCNTSLASLQHSHHWLSKHAPSPSSDHQMVCDDCSSALGYHSHHLFNHWLRNHCTHPSRRSQLAAVNARNLLTTGANIVLTCDVCWRIFRGVRAKCSASLFQHWIRSHERIAAFTRNRYPATCDFCCQQYADKQKLVIHWNSLERSSDIKAVCDVCGPSVLLFRSRANLTSHLYAHGSLAYPKRVRHVEKVRCDECDKALPRPNMGNHIQAMH